MTAAAPISSTPPPDQFLAAAAAAAPRWGLEPTAIKIMSHSENVVCEVTLSDSERLVMRLHRPGYNTLDELRSEVRWVQALATAGLPVPQPRPTLDSDYYASVEVGLETRQAGVIEWVAGQPIGGPLDSGSGDVVGHYGRIGELAAQIRLHNERWQPDDAFVRRRWDAQALLGEDPLWGRFWASEGLSRGQQDLFAKARDELFARLDQLSTGPDRFGLIHADLHLGNVMADGDLLTLIDFDDSGFGWFAHELAVALHPVSSEPWFAEAKDALIAGYGRVHQLAAEEIELIDLFLTVRGLMIVGWLSARPELAVHAYLKDVAHESEGRVRRFLATGTL